MECLYKHANNHNQFGQKSSELIHNHLSMILNNCLWPASIFPETKIRNFFIIDATDFYSNNGSSTRIPKLRLRRSMIEKTYQTESTKNWIKLHGTSEYTIRYTNLLLLKRYYSIIKNSPRSVVVSYIYTRHGAIKPSDSVHSFCAWKYSWLEFQSIRTFS